MKHTEKIKRYFNLIEVSLALGVTALGVTGVMTVLPYAMKSASNASNETYLASAANMIFAEINRSITEDRLEKLKNSSTGVLSEDDLEELADIFVEKLGSDDNGRKVNITDKFSGVSATSENGIGWQDGEDFSDAAGYMKYTHSDDTAVVRFYTKGYGGREIKQAEFNVRIFSTPIDVDEYAYTDSIRGYEQASSELVNKKVIDPATGQPKMIKFRVPGGVKARRYPALSSGHASNNEDMTEVEKNAEKQEQEKYEVEKKFWRRVYVELSWPVGKESVNDDNIKFKTKKYFVQEFYFTDIPASAYSSGGSN